MIPWGTTKVVSLLGKSLQWPLFRRFCCQCALAPDTFYILSLEEANRLPCLFTCCVRYYNYIIFFTIPKKNIPGVSHTNIKGTVRKTAIHHLTWSCCAVFVLILMNLWDPYTINSRPCNCHLNECIQLCLNDLRAFPILCKYLTRNGINAPFLCSELRQALMWRFLNSAHCTQNSASPQPYTNSSKE